MAEEEKAARKEAEEASQTQSTAHEEEHLPDDNPSDEEFFKKMAGSATLASEFPEAAEAFNFSNEEAEKLKEENASQAERIAELEDQLKRTAAELQNLRRRTQKELEEARKFGAKDFARDMTGVMENLHRALDNIPEDKLADNELLKNIHVGIQMTYDELKKHFDRHELVRIHPEGDIFDPNLHQAVCRVETAETDPGKIVNVLNAGYTFKDRLLHPAMVTVAIKPLSDKADSEETAKTEEAETDSEPDVEKAEAESPKADMPQS